VVIDTGVAVSALLLPHSMPRQALDLAVSRCFLLVSAETIEELEDVLRRPKFNKCLDEAQRLEFLAALAREAVVVEVTSTVAECRDPKDDNFLELATSGRASHIVSGDADLLVLNPFREISIVSPRDFVECVRAWTCRSSFPTQGVALVITRKAAKVLEMRATTTATPWAGLSRPLRDKAAHGPARKQRPR
jgi:putative PIN family toxin of toxin-antitoxin system